MIKKHSWFIALLILYLVVNILFLVKHPGSIFNFPQRFGEQISIYGSRDASLYAKMAWQLINDGVYGYNADYSNAYVTPGQPFYLVAIFKLAEILNTNHIVLYRLSNMVLNLSIVTLIYMISLRLFKIKWIGLGAALLYCTHIAPFHYFRAALTEMPSIFFFLLSIYIFLVALERKKYRYHILFGLIASILLMFRATPAPMLLFAWALVLVRSGFKEGVKIGFIWCIGPLLIMVPWVVRNLQLFEHAYLFSSHAGSPLLGGTSPYYMGDQGLLVEEARQKGLSLEEYGKQRIKEGFTEDFPLFFSWFTVGKTLWLFMDQSGNPDGLGPYAQSFPNWIKSFFKYQNIFVSFSGLLFAFALRKHKPLVYLSTIILIYIVFSNIFLTIPRYGLLVMPILAIISSYGVYTCTKWLAMKFQKNKNKSNSNIE
jgi:4-amino-4-deoxy-L-arabinose transferase-like glycosyltransferase